MCLGCNRMCCSGLSAMGVHTKNWPKVSYVVTDIFYMLIAFALMFTGRIIT